MADAGTQAEPLPTGLKRRDAVVIALISAGAAWGAGNVGPVVPDLANDFGLSLASVGVLSGTLFYIGTLTGLLLAPKAVEKYDVVNGMRIACLAAGLGSLIFAVGPSFLYLAIGRGIEGVALGFAAAAGPVFARAVGGVKGVGLFGGAFQFGIALGLGVGSVLGDLGADWRIGFFVSSAMGFSALLWLRDHHRVSFESTSEGFLRRAAVSPPVYRLAALFIALFTVPLILGAWLVHYLTVEGDMRVALAGVLAFILFGVSALLRIVGATLAARGFSTKILAGVTPLLATIGIVMIAIDRSFGVALPAVILIGAGFALPYAVSIIAAQKLYPTEPADPVALMTAVASGLPIFLIPIFGALLAAGHGEVALLAIAVFVAIAAALNAKLPDKPIVT